MFELWIVFIGMNALIMKFKSETKEQPANML